VGVGGGLYLVALLVVGVGVGRAHVNSSARVKAGGGRLGGEYAVRFIMFVIDPPYVRKGYLLRFVNSAMSSCLGCAMTACRRRDQATTVRHGLHSYPLQ
jgi:hypothetical protein